MLVTETNLLKKDIIVRAAELPMGVDSFTAHKNLIRHWTGRGTRWKMICETIMKSPLGVRPLAQEAADVAREPILFNRRILPNGKTPLGGQKSAARLKDWNLGKLRCTGADGDLVFKSLEQLKTELGEIGPARLVLKALEAVPEDWRKALVAAGGVSSAASQQQPLPYISNEGIFSLKQMREFWGSGRASNKQAKWGSRWGKRIDWREIIAIRDSRVIPNRPRSVLLRIHGLNLQVGERVAFLRCKPVCPYCSEEETLEHCLFTCPVIQSVATSILRALRMMNPARHISSLGDLLFKRAGSDSAFPEATLAAIVLHQIWVERCEAVFRGGKFRARRVLRRIERAFYLHARIYLKEQRTKLRKGAGGPRKSKWARLLADEQRLFGHITVADGLKWKWTSGFAAIWSKKRRAHRSSSGSGSASDSAIDSTSSSGWETAGVAPGKDSGDRVVIGAAAAAAATSGEPIGASGAGGGAGGGGGSEARGSGASSSSDSVSPESTATLNQHAPPLVGSGAAAVGATPAAVHPAASALQALALASLPPPSVVPSLAAPLVSAASAALASLTVAVPSESPPSQSPPSQSPPSQSPPLSVLAADVISDVAGDVARIGGIPSEPLLGAPWSPDGRKYLLALCSTGGMSNHLFCLREFALLAGALNRTLVVPMGPHELTLPLSLVFDVPFLRACYGPKTALTLDKYKQFVGRGSMEVTHVLCLVKGCHLVPDAAPGGQFKASKGRISLANVSVPAVEQWAWSGLPDKHSLQAFVKVYSRVPDGVLVIGEFKKQPITDSIFFRMLAPMDLPFLLPPPLGKQRGKAKPGKVVPRETCLSSPAIRPPEALIAVARHIVQNHLLDGQFLAVQFRRGDFKDYCRKKHPSDGCFLPVDQAAQCMRAAAVAARAPLVFLATNARPHEVAAIAATLLETPQGKPLEVAATAAAAAGAGAASAATAAAAVEQGQPVSKPLERRRMLGRFAEELPLPAKEPRSLQGVAQPSGSDSQSLDPRTQRSMPGIARRMLPGGSSGVEVSPLDEQQPANSSSNSSSPDSSSAVQLVTLAHLLSKEDSSLWLQSLLENGINLKTTPQAAATLEKLVCALGAGFLGTAHSTFTNDIVRLRHGFRTARCSDDYICSAGPKER
ncbi:unnamed protein product [Closterium sp. Naga37s-1]|nr:unnamed protein product [Closterium sp. Naga37s-1]